MILSFYGNKDKSLYVDNYHAPSGHSSSNRLTSLTLKMCSPPFSYFLQLRTLGTCAKPPSPDPEEKVRLAYYEYLSTLSEARRRRIRSAHSYTRVSITSATVRGNL